MKFIISNDITLLEAVAHMAPDSSKATLRSWIKDGRVLVDDAPNRIASTLLVRGQSVSIGAKSRFIEDKIRVIYEDDHLVVIEKPEGLLSVSTDGEKYHTAYAILKRHYRSKNVQVVHRLDQDTSGTMVFAFTDDAYAWLKTLFADHDIERRYTAIVEGHLKEKSGTWESYLHQDSNYHVHSTQNPALGVLAITHYSVIGESKNCTSLDLKLETGKKNQIRVHCQNAGHPVLGDIKYGGKPHPLKRLCLHAYHLAFKHPVTKKLMHFDSPIPIIFNKIVSLPEA